jgi:glycogen(starch) synthase
MTALDAGLRDRSERSDRPAGDRQRPLRQVLMTADAVGGVWQYALSLAGELRQVGIATTLAVMGPAPTRSQRRDAARSGVAILYRPFRLEWMPAPWNDVDEAGRWLLTLEREQRPDVVQVNGYAHASLAWKAPVVAVAHSCVCSWWRAVKGAPGHNELDEYRARVTAGLRAAHALVAPSAAMRQALRHEYGVTAPCHIVANGTRVQARPGRPAKEPFVFAAGRVWDEAKNMSSLMKVAPHLEWPIYLAGDRAAPDGRTAALDGIVPLGRLSTAATRRWFRRAAIYALPARYEPFGLSVLEAAAAGCALVLGDIPSLRENWNGAARFVPPDDLDALESTLQALIGDEGQRQSLAEAALVRARDFGLAPMREAYLAVYRSVLR